jgi:glycosyltransferase involved in cell wall biosynthesis
MKRLLLRSSIRFFIAVLSLLSGTAALLRRRKKPFPAEGLHIVLTGTFYSDNWLETHLRPMGASRLIRRVTMVAAVPVPAMPGVEAVYPHARLVRVLGASTARLVTFVVVAVREKADIVGGFHLLINGLVALLVARAGGRRAMYICGGGEREVEGGGYATENQIFRRLGAPSPYVERKLLEAAVAFDYLVTMGESVRKFFLERGAGGQVVVVPGGFDAELFRPAVAEPVYDLILVGRMSPVKRIDVFVRVLQSLEDTAIRAVVVGDGPSAGELRQLARDCGVAERLDFVGWQGDVQSWLRKSRIFVLTSESEGLSQAMVQAMLCGLPVVVTDVGDLKDLVVHGRNGFLTAPGEVEECAEKVSLLCGDGNLRRTMGAEARLDALRLSVPNVSAQWDGILAGEPCY